MNSRNLFCGFALAALMLLSACNNSGGDDNQTNFRDFVQTLATTPVDNADPVPINDCDFEFNENPNAFDDLFQ